MAPALGPVPNRRTGETIRFLGVDRSGAVPALRFRIDLAPRAAGPPPHAHPRQDETIAVLAGTVVLRLGGRTRVHGPGDVVRVPPGAMHAFRNPSDAPAALEGSLRPPRAFEALVRELYPLMDARRGGLPPVPAMAAVLARHPDELRLPGLPGWAHRPVLAALGALARRR